MNILPSFLLETLINKVLSKFKRILHEISI
jgi:hypothetical protein